MNSGLPGEVKEQYTTVLDGGSLEHVFNFPMAIRNCMEMVSVGGHYLGITPANNLMGHGFYQFSPELYFSVFARENGFDLISLIACEDRKRATWYAVRSPREVRRRVTLTNAVPVSLLIVAKRVMKTVIFETTPQQNDYLSVWHQYATASDRVPPAAPRATRRVSPLDRGKRRIPVLLKRLVRRVVRIHRGGFDPRFFQPLDPTKSERSLNKSLQRTP
jgi:hypothetical protein